MTTPVRFTSAAGQDLTAAFLWYEGQSAGLGTRLVSRMEELLERIAEAPRQFPEVTSGYRRALLPRFPYGVYFSVSADDIRVHAVLHLHRDPAHWRKRPSGGTG